MLASVERQPLLTLFRLKLCRTGKTEAVPGPYPRGRQTGLTSLRCPAQRRRPLPTPCNKLTVLLCPGASSSVSLILLICKMETIVSAAVISGG